MKKVLLLLLVSLLILILVACGNKETNKQVPVYEGMTVSSTTEVANNGMGNVSFFSYKMDSEKLDVYPEGYDYYADRGEDIYIHIHINNPDNFEILSFTLNGQKYSDYMFEDGSDMETIIIKCNVGNESGIKEYTIDAVKYIDKQAIKDVILKGKQTISIHISNNEYVPDEPDIKPACTHDDLTKIVFLEGKIPTCVEKGLTDGQYCSACGETLVAQQELPLVDHTYDDDYDTTCNICSFTRPIDCKHTNTNILKAKDPTCTEVGLTEGKVCINCQEILIKQESIEALKHDWKDATCTTAQTCNRCGITNGTELGHKYVNNACSVCGETRQFSYTDEQGVSYQNDTEGNLVVVNFDGTSKNITIPETIDGYKVTKINDNAFKNSKIESITLPSTITEIGSSAFYECYYLQTVSLNEGLISIGEFAFLGAGIINISIPECVTEIQKMAFAFCKDLQRVELPNSISELGEGLFGECTSLTEVVLPSNITTIPYAMFNGCISLSQIYIPESVIEIGESAFNYCNALKTIVIPKSVVKIGWSVFSNCHNLESITLPFIGKDVDDINENTHFGFIFGATTYKEQDRDHTIIPYSLKEVIITGTMYEDYGRKTRWIDEYAFYSCDFIERIVIADSVETIGDGAFQNCAGLQSITLGEHVTSIGDEAFEGCWCLNNVYVQCPGGLGFKEIDDIMSIGTENEQLTNANAFFYMESDPALEGLEGKYWHYVDGIETPWPNYVALVSEGLVYKYTYQPDYNNIIAGIGTCKDSVIYIPTIAPDRWGLYFDVIGEKAFSGCSQITEVVIPKNIKEIRAFAFSDCVNLRVIKYRGTEEEWNSIIKGEGWDANTNFTIIFNYKGD